MYLQCSDLKSVVIINFWFEVGECNHIFSLENFKKDKIKQLKKIINYTINKHTIDRFKVVVDKDIRKMSNVVENLIR